MKSLIFLIAITNESMATFAIIPTVNNRSITFQFISYQLFPFCPTIIRFINVSQAITITVYRVKPLYRILCISSTYINRIPHINIGPNLPHQGRYSICLFLRKFSIFINKRHLVPLIRPVGNRKSTPIFIYSITASNSLYRILMISHDNGKCRSYTSGYSMVSINDGCLPIVRISLIPPCGCKQYLGRSRPQITS